MRVVDTKLDKQLEKAIKFLVNASPEESGKPVILHSIRVGFYLYERGHSRETVVAGILHDTLEDSGASYKEIGKKFGKRVAQLVKANSFDKDILGKTIEDKKKRHEQVLARCMAVGEQALIIKAADILDNSYYYHLTPNKKLREWLLKKMKNFLETSATIINTESVWKELNKQYKIISN